MTFFTNIFNKIKEFFKNLFRKKNRVVYAPVNNLQEWSQFEKDIFALINEYRGINKKLPFIAEKAGWIEARKRLIVKTEEYNTTGTITHQFIGAPIKALKALGFKTVYEILGVGYSSAESIVGAWKRSESHNNILLGDNIRIGLAQGNAKNGRNVFCGLLFD